MKQTRPPRSPLARVITVVSAPALLVIALPLTVGVATRGWAGFWWGLFAAMCGGVPSALIYAGLRSKPFTDRRDGRRGLRSSLIWLIVALVIASITVLLVFGPPHTMVVTVAITLATVLFLGPITISWKISLHTAVAFASVVVLANVWPAVPVYAAGTAATALIGWSRVRLGDHTPAQAIYGALAGGFIAWLTIYWLGWG